MSALYPRTISILRPTEDFNQYRDGLQPNRSGLAQDKERLIASAIPASIQIERQGRPPIAQLPGDAEGRGSWRIFFNQPNGTVKQNDIIEDDLCVRYQVIMPYWDSLGYACLCETLHP